MTNKNGIGQPRSLRGGVERQLRLRLALGFTLSVLCLSCLAPESDYPTKLEPKTPDYVCAEMSTSKGNITLSLDRANAPLTTENFMQYVEDKFYDSTLFHRVIEDFMIQGGGYFYNYSKKTTRLSIEHEGYNGLTNVRGTLAMARTSEPNSATAQFFINVVDNEFLNYQKDRTWGYAVFGKVSKGMSVVDAIRTVETGAVNRFSEDAPLTEIVIYKIRKVTCD